MDSRRHRHYECSRRKRDDNACPIGTTVREDYVLREIAAYLENWLGRIDAETIGTAAYYGAFNQDKLPDWFPRKAFDEIRRLVLPRTRPKRDRERLAKQVEQLMAKAAKARENLAKVDAEFIPGLQDQIRNLDAQRAELENELKESKPPSEKDIYETVLAVVHSLYSLAEMCRLLVPPVDDGWKRSSTLKNMVPHAVRRFLTNIESITVHTKKVGRGTGTRHVFDRSEIALARVGGVMGNSNPHQPA